MDEAIHEEVLQPQSPFSYQCQHCFHCCRSRPIPLNPYDISRLAAYRSISTGQFIDRYLLLSEQGAFLRQALEGDCAFLGENGCLVYQCRPLACRNYPLLRQVDLDGRASLIKLKPRTGSEGLYQTEGNVENFLIQNHCTKASKAADRYTELFVTIFKRMEQGDVNISNTQTLLADPILFQTILLDMDLMVDCFQRGTEPPLDPDQKQRLHIHAINAWLSGELKTFVLLNAFAKAQNAPSGSNNLNRTYFTSEIEGCAWPLVTKRLNTWAIALDYQFKQETNTTGLDPENHLLLQLESLLNQHSQFSPFYRARCAGNELEPSNYQGFRGAPLLHREQLRQAGMSLFSTQVPPSHGAVNQQPTATSGSPKLVINTTELCLAFQKALFAGLHISAPRNHESQCTIVLPGATLSEANSPLHWASTPGNRPTTILDSKALTATELFESLLIARPTEIVTTAENWALLHRLMVKNDIQIHGLEQVFILQSIETGFSSKAHFSVSATPLTEIFTLVEVGIIASRKAQDEAYSVPAGHLLVEILNHQNNPCQDGEPGRIVVTDLHNFATPIIRYETGVTGAPVIRCSSREDATGCFQFTLIGWPSDA